MNERDYQRGRTAVAQDILRAINDDLGSSGRSLRAMRNERANTIASLRDLCERFGDNEWEDDLNMSDIIEKHLARHLRERR